MSTVEILILFYSVNGSVAAMARLAARGVEEVCGASARIRTVPRVTPAYEPRERRVPSSGPPYVETSDLSECDGLLLGSPTRFGQMAAPLRYFMDSTSDAWLSGALAGKPGGAFTSSSSQHGGQESTLLGMLLPLMHHGMLLVGLPYTEPALLTTRSGGSPYGAGHVAPRDDNRVVLSPEERTLCTTLGRRVATTALHLKLGAGADRG